ncbi:MAG: hypothetical protein DRP06_02370 [Candidatus Aenigmatarchaeota archaeon]|nr:MAG: hypothetical protein DRP06_02370 [Candidatus Aenigmarchaeota archaeon]
MRKELFILFLLVISAILPAVSAQEDKNICAVYFTYIGCPNCAAVDPVVLSTWMEKYPNLVVIEYMWHGGDWQDPNSQFFGEYTQKYKIQAAVPQFIIGKNNIKLGRLEVPTAEEDIKTKESNPCLLFDKSISFEELNLRELKAKPKIWVNGRILIKQEDNWVFQWNGEKIPEVAIGNKSINNSLAKELLFTENISKILRGKKFKIAEPQRADFSASVFTDSEYLPYVEFENAIEIELDESEPIESGEKENGEEEIKKDESIEFPFIGKIKTSEVSLPVLTVFLALVDGVTNPCGFFVLFFLLAALLGLAGSRKKIFIVGGIFIFFFALYYFLFMAVLLNIFVLGKEIAILTIIAGIMCIIAGLLNIKDYFFFQRGISFSLSKGKRSKLTERVKKLSLAKSIPVLILGTIIIASTVSLVAIACTFGIPLAYTKILTSNSLPYMQYYLYLVFYNIVYIIPMAIIVSIFAVTLGKRKFGKTWIKRLKLISGLIILFLGSVLIWNYTLLENVVFLFYIIISAVILSGLIILFSENFKKFKRNK